MIKYYEIGDYKFPYDPTIEKVGIKASAGVDSSLILYILADLRRQGLIKSQFVTMTVDHHDRPYQIDYVNRILNYITQVTGEVFEYRLSQFSQTEDIWHNNCSTIVQEAKNSLQFSKHYMGITANPPANAGIGTSDPERTHDNNKSVHTEYKFTPWINYHKKDIAEIYKILNLDELFSMTRSCEERTFNFSTHCGNCWWCKERYWGFGKYE